MQKSYFGMPLSVFFHMTAINITLYYFTQETYRYGIAGVIYYNLAWVILTYSLNFYRIAQKQKFTTRVLNFLSLFVLYGLVFFASFTFLGPNVYKPLYLLGVYVFICSQLIFFHMLFHWARDKYRSKESHKTKVVVVGWDKNLKKVRAIFDSPEHNYQYIGFFDNQTSQSPTYLGPINNCYQYIFENEISEVYCIASRLSKEEIRLLMQIADNSLKRIKIIPDNKELFSRAMSIELYGDVPVLNLRASPLDLEYANIVKRAVDIIFSSLVIIFILSWLVPVVYLLQRFDSKGPLLFKQQRHGVNKKIFWCYKFRSMSPTKDCNTKMATKNDMRVTRLGRILRKTSIDELPQFYNVLIGDMSVVGPRPHMVVHTQEFENSVDKYLVRHFLKPGITGLAQISGYRGEIMVKSDIINRVRYDIFYMEKWSLRLDAKIIYLTVFNALKGDTNAY